MAEYQRSRQIAILEDMLQRLLAEQAAASDVDAEKAQHLAEAVVDLRTVIARVESYRSAYSRQHEREIA